jgi:hypothetical protein
MIGKKASKREGNDVEIMSESNEEEFEFEYIEEEYPEETPIEEIMKGCKKGDVIMP